MVPLDPVPVAPEVIESHAALELADHEHEGPFVEIVTVPVPPEEATVAVAGERAVTAHAPADCVTVWVCPPAEIVALRETAFVFAATEYWMVPLAPVPEAPEVIESHAASEDADHEQFVPFVEIVVLPVPAAAEKLAVAGEKPLTTHAAADWVMVMVAFDAVPLETVIVAARETVLGFAEAVKVNAPSPVPEAPDSTSHAWLLEADHGQSGPVTSTETETGLEVPPEAMVVEPAVARSVSQIAAGYATATVPIDCCAVPVVPPT